jgi:hypothetical protein
VDMIAISLPANLKVLPLQAPKKHFSRWGMSTKKKTPAVGWAQATVLTVALLIV